MRSAASKRERLHPSSRLRSNNLLLATVKCLIESWYKMHLKCLEKRSSELAWPGDNYCAAHSCIDRL